MAGRPNLNLQPSGPEALPVKISGSSASESEKPESGPEGATKLYITLLALLYMFLF